MKRSGIVIAIIFLSMLKIPAQTSAADSCEISIYSCFCPNCPMDTAIQSWIIRYNGICGIVRLHYQIYEPGKSKLIHDSPDHWTGLIKTDSLGNRRYYPSGAYPYVIRFYKSDQSVILREASVSLTNYERF